MMGPGVSLEGEELHHYSATDVRREPILKYVVGRGWRCRVKIANINVDSGVKNGVRYET